jgi:hypothetical protein
MAARKEPLYHGQVLYKYLVLQAITVFFCSAINATLQKENLLFPERFAPKTIFDTLFASLYMGASLVFFWPHYSSFYSNVSNI